MKIGEMARRAWLRPIRRIADRYAWTHPSILATFAGCPPYLVSFKNAWLSLLWGPPEHRRLREAVAVAVSVANRCHY